MPIIRRSGTIPTTPELRLDYNWHETFTALTEDDPTRGRDSGFDSMMWSAEDELEKWDEFIAELRKEKD